MHDPDNNDGVESIELKINSDAVTASTRAVLNERLKRAKTSVPLFFDTESYKILVALCSRLIPQNDTNGKVDIAGVLDENVFHKKGKGWRYDVMPPAGKAFTIGLRSLDEKAVNGYHRHFYDLDATEQDDMIDELALNERAENRAGLFFEELLATVVEIYYSHPFAKEIIGDMSFADAKGREL